MDLSSGDISAIVFKPVVKDDLGNFSLDGHMLSVLMTLDGELTLGHVAQKTGLNMANLREATSKLLNLDLIEAVERVAHKADRDFFDYLIAELSLAIGPLAEVIVEDGVEDLGHTLQSFPTHQAAELINLLAQEIQRDDKKSEFKQNMVSKIKQKGY
jgi:DNA-binding transcriptional regulator GbsR (MarR family)